jgi:prepilin-type N-terminal cleavage/methylation domain-containing protein
MLALDNRSALDNHSGRSRREDGFTLVELLIVVVILGVVIAPLTVGIILFLRNTDQTSDRMSESHDAQIAAAYFAQDVRNSGLRNWNDLDTPYGPVQAIELNVDATGGLHPCGTSETGPALVRFAWDDLVDSSRAMRVAYVVAGRELHRITCDPSGAITSQQVMAHNLDPASPPVVSCWNRAGAAVASCDTVTTNVANHTASVRLVLTLRAPSSTSPYQVTLVGERRQI